MFSLEEKEKKIKNHIVFGQVGWRISTDGERNSLHRLDERKRARKIFDKHMQWKSRKTVLMTRPYFKYFNHLHIKAQ